MNNIDIINKKINDLNKSKFRSNFKLKNKDKEYISKIGLNVIVEHAYDFVNKRLASEVIINDGKQTPMRGHPVFIAQHATATCCRGCLNKWHGINENKKLTDNEINYIVSIIIGWIMNEFDKKD